MYLIVGLGNPGTKYEQTRHNFGFAVLDLLTGVRRPVRQSFSVGGSLGEGGWENKYDSLFLKLDDVILAKPQTFMNNSGQAIKEILKFYPAAQLVVIHDELDLPLGSIKIQKNVSGAGHNGVQSIIDELGTKDFVRLRLGVENPVTRKELPGDAYVLEKFTDEENKIVVEVLEKAKAAVETIQTDGLDIAQSKFNG